MKKLKVSFWILAALFAMSGIQAHAQLFPNGDFEAGPGGGCQCPTGFTCGNDAGRVVDGTHPVWAVGNNGCVTGPTNYAPSLGAFGGTSSVYFYAGADNFDAPAVNFAGGEEVCLSIWYCGPQGAGASGQNTANSHFAFKLDGTQIGPDVLVPTNTGWTEHTFTVIMTPGNHTFGVISGGAAQYSIWFDNFNADLCSAPSCDPSWTTTTTCSTDPPINLDALITGDAGGTWSGTGVTGNMFDPAVGTQSITYTNAAPCTDFSTQSITVTTTADASWASPGAICEADGIIDLNTFITGTAGGTWSGTGVTGSNFDPTGLTGAINITYTVGTAPCDATSSQDITVVTNPDPSWTPSGPLCSTDPIIDLNTLISGTSGGTWSGTGVTGSNFDPSAGTQSITYTVGSGSCQQTSTQDITVSASGDPSWTTLALCSSDGPTDLTAQITGDAGGTWSGTGMTGSVFDPNSGTQDITYTIGFGTCMQTSTQTILVVDPQLSASSTNIACFGETNGTANVTVSGGSGNYSYSWNSTPAQTTANASNLPSGTYTVTVTDITAGCTSTATVDIIEPAELTTATSGVDACSPSSGLATVEASGGVGGFSYLWSPSGATTNSIAFSDSAMAYVSVTDANGCTKDDSVFINIWPNPTISTFPSSSILYGECVPLGAIGGSNYLWTPNYELDCDNCQSPVACPEETTKYCVSGNNAYGCTDTACMIINVEIVCGEVFVPSAFSPNDDGENDLECIYSDCLQDFTLSIYNRWGQKVFETSNKNICWDGTWKNKPLNSAVFVYVLEGYLINGERVSQKGNISLIR
ncbi:MAG: gliding motility-associated C-terminal domain-containing protein [Crocinitomicaceae bacterium]